MSGTDPDSKPEPRLDRTQAYEPDIGAPQQKQPDNLPRIPGITLHFELARGGMGVVYSGRQDFLDRRVAVKLLSVELGGESFVQRFQREAKILAGIKHPNIVACHMAGQTDAGQSYLVMEFIDGPSMKKWITDHGQVPVTAALRTVRAVAQALAHAHTLGIIHRDVKPENILLETVTSTALDIHFPFTPKVVDLGLARSASSGAGMGLTSPGSVMGTPATMSPEQYDEPDAVDFRTDIYGLGCVLYEMLVGQPAFRGKRLSDIITKKREPVAPNPCAENGDVPAEVGGLVQRMLATHRDERPGSYKALDEQLVALLDSVQSTGSRVAKAKPIVGDETGSTMIAQRERTNAPQSKTGAGKTGAAKTSPPPDAGKDPTGAGLLRSAEINFLQEGLDQVGPAKAEPAFRDSGVKATSTFGSSSVAAPKKRTGMIVTAVLAVIALGAGVWFGLKPGSDGSGGTGKRPVITSIKNIKGKATFDLDTPIDLEAVATDEDSEKLTYTWSYDSELIGARGRTDQAIARFQFDEGLPGVPAVIKVTVSDAQNNTVDKTHEVVCGECPKVSLSDLMERGEFQRDKTGGIGWTAVFRDRSLSCQARGELRTLAGPLGDDTYWEWFGTLVSKDDQGFPYARLGARFEIGEQAWVIECRRSGDDGEKWSVEALAATRSGDTWTTAPLATPLRAEWPEPETDDEPRAMFSVQRRGNELVLQVGEASKPVAENAAEILKPKDPVIIKLPNGATNGNVTWFVDKGIGEFRVQRR